MGCSAWRRGWFGRARASTRVRFVVLGATALGLLLCSSPAMALTQQGHEFSSTFGAGGTGEGQFSNPSGVAVSEVGPAAGDVYVVDRGNNRVEQFSAKGKFLAAWGWGVKNGNKEYEVCEAHEGCQAGTPDTGNGVEKLHLGKGQLVAPEAIAVDDSTSPADPSAGDVYVVASVALEKSVVYKFGPDGEYIGHLSRKEEQEDYGRVDGVAVDTKGDVWLAWSEETGKVASFDNQVNNRRLGEEGYEIEGAASAVRPGFAVDARDNLYLNFEPGEKFVLADEEANPGFNEEGKGEHGEEPCEGTLSCFIAKVNIPAGSEEEERPPEVGEAFVDGLFGETARAVAVDLSTNDVYVSHEGSISAYGSNGNFVERFGEGHLEGGRGVAVNSGTGQLYVADATTNTVVVFKLEEEAAPPTVDQLSAAKITTGSAELSAQVNPTGGANPSVSFQYGTEACSGGGCTSVGDSDPIVTGFNDQAAQVALTGLAPGATYHYRVVVHTDSGETTSKEQTFTTLPFTLPDGRAWEMVSQPAKNGAGLESLPKEGGVVEASEDGNAITYIATGPSEGEPEGNRSPAFTQNLATRSLTGWSSKEIAIPNPERPAGVSPGKQQEYLYFTQDLALAMVEPVGRYNESEPLLSPEAPEKTIYVRHNEGCAPPPSSCYVPLVTANDDTAPEPKPFGGKPGTIGTGVRYLGATTDLSHVVLKAEVPLTGEPTSSEGNLYEWTAGKPSAEQLQLINVLPNETPAAGSLYLGIGELRRNAISSDGSRVIWTDKNAEGSAHLYTRNMPARETTQVDTPEAEVELGVEEHPQFQTASANGGKVFFTDEQRLTTTSTSPDEKGKPDLYVFETGTGKLTDLTHALPGEAASVQGLVMGTNEEASTVYFVADGVLSENANGQGETATPGSCREGEKYPAATCNLYVIQQNTTTGVWGTPVFIARLSSRDEPDWGLVSRDDLGEVTSRVSPKGQYLAFMSQRSLTGYDNRVTNPEAEGSHAEEVYRYELGSEGPGRLICVSCNPTGARPNGVIDKEEAGEGIGLLVDRIGVWGAQAAGEEQWLAGSIPGWTQDEGKEAQYQSRYLSDTGRLFFDSADSLVPADENGKEDVYEYERSGEGSCQSEEGCVSLISSATSNEESAFLDASVSGNDVFFLTTSTLVPSDKDTNFDVYDARVCTEGSPCVTPTTTSTNTCESTDSCKAPATEAPAYAPPPTATPSGSGNLAAPPKTSVLPNKAATKPLTRLQKLAKALKSCKKLKHRSKRLACERVAHRRLGYKKAAKKAAATSSRSHA